MPEHRASDPLSPDFVPICAIGASAGGVEALQTLFRLLPSDLGLAYVVIMHLAPDHPSAMGEILGACTEMPVLQVDDSPRLRANCVYVIAPDRELVVDGDDVRSRPFTDPRNRRAPIDMFFRSIAAGRGDGIAVVLTGAGADGALGVRAVKEAGGIVMVQEPTEAGHPSMPRNAVATGVADVVAPLAQLPRRIADAARNKEAVRSLDESGVADDVRRIVAFLRTRTGHDFSGYKRSTVLRRIQRRMQVRQVATPAEYARCLRADPDEARALLSDLLISVTMFFRDPTTFAALNRLVVRPLLESRGAEDGEGEIRAWVVGCATGEEAYSLAILLLEESERQKVSVPMQIFATDLDEGALATAREGRYPRAVEADVSAERLKRFFVDEGTHYRIDRRVRDIVLFAAHSVVREPPFMRLDLITCRNVLIYLERALQQQVGSIFHYGLKTDGFLFLGTAETADASAKQFAVVDREARIYRALPARSELLPALSASPAWSAGRFMLTENRLVASRFDATEALGESHAAALETGGPPSALVDAEQNVLHLSPTAGRFILLSAGPLSGRLSSIVRPELRLDLKLALDRAVDSRQPSLTRPIDVSMDGETRRVSLYAAPLPTNKGAAARAIVCFLDGGPGRADEVEKSVPPRDELRHLHSELKVAQEAELAGRLRHESALQELRASNEELQSLNEEYRSTAEELETSKEELQSINEELQTVNAELKSKLGIISGAHNDLQNLTASSEIGTLFLDLELRIRMFTPPVARLINVTDADVGRPITNFTHRLEYDDVEADVRRVLRELTPFETEARSVDGRWFVVRVRPYRTTEGKVEGAVVTFDDDTERRRGREALRENEQKYRSLFESVDEGVGIVEMVRDAAGETTDYRFIDVNSAFARRIELTDAVGRFGSEVAPEQGRRWIELYGRVARTGEPIRFEQRAEATDRWYEISAARLDPSDDARVRIVLDDVTDRKRVERVLRESESWLAAQKDAFRAAMDDAPLDRSLGVLTAWMNENAEGGRRCAFYLADEEGVGLRHVVGMSEEYARATDGFAISPESLCCGLAVAAGRPVVTRDVRDDPTWREWTWLAEAHGYRACWSFPVETAAGRLIGAFAEYFAEPREPNARDFELATAVAQTAGIIISRYRENGERAKAEAALRASEARYQALFRASPAPFLILAPDAPRFTVTDVNDAYLAVVARTRRDVVGRGVFEAFPASSAETALAGSRVLRDSLERALASRRADTPPVLRYDVARPDGAFEERWWSLVHSPVLDENGEVKAIIHGADDVTVERRAEAALSESETRFRTLAETAPALIWQNGVDGGNVFVNRYFLDYVGLPAEEIRDARWLSLIHPDDAEAYVGDYMDAVKRARPFRSRNRIRRRDGAWRWFENYAQPLFDERGRYAGHVGVSTDVTVTAEAELSLRESERRQQVLIEGVPQLVWRAVGDGHWTWASPQWTAYTGQAERDSHGYGWLDPVHPDDREPARRAWAGAVERGDFHAEYRVRRAADGKYRWFQTRATPVRDDDRIVEWLGTSTDIDDLRQLQERQGVLVAELQHRTRNLITVVRAVSRQTIREAGSLEEFRDRFADRLSALSRVQGLLSHLSAGRRVTFGDVLKSELAALGAPESKVILDGPDEVPLKSATVQTFSLALHELATNALKYGALASTEGRLTVRWELVSDEGAPRLRVDWRETGVDMTHVDLRSRGGYGRELIENALPYQLGAKTTYAMTSEGVHCVIDVPISAAKE